MEVGAYAEKDAELTLELWQFLKKEIIYQDVESIFNLETDLFPLFGRHAISWGESGR